MAVARPHMYPKEGEGSRQTQTREIQKRVIVGGMSFAAPLNEMSETNFRQQSRKEGRARSLGEGGEGGTVGGGRRISHS